MPFLAKEHVDIPTKDVRKCSVKQITTNLTPLA
jgi:hypothetical protein